MRKIHLYLFLTVFGVLASACTNDSFNEIDGALLKDPNFNTGTFTATISVANIKEDAIQTNGLGGYLLGQYTQAPFGTKSATIIAQVGLTSVNPTFGSYSQANEDKNNKQENETVTEAYLYIPFYTPYTSSNNFTYTKDTEYQLDSIYGNKAATFGIDIKELNYFLSNIGADLKSKEYYSNDSALRTQLGNSIAATSTATFSISNKGIVRYEFDNPQTTDDESKKQHDVLAPGLRIPLDANFFQSKIISKEGSAALQNLTDFQKYFRGIAISANNLSAEVMMLLNMASAKIEIVYTYNATVKGETKVQKNRFEMPVNGIAINLFNNSGETLTDSSKIYLSGALGQIANLTIADTDIARMKSEKLMVSDASLLLYIDTDVSYLKEPERLYIYNANTGASLADYQYDPTSNQASASAELIHLGKLHKENGKGTYYRLRITNHILNLISSNTANVPLAISIGSNVKNTNSVNYQKGSNKKKVAVQTAVTPLGTVIKDVKLIINYTKAK
ncbi:DUF4270 domain-containing protein [Capnocytophaga sp. oral taxon 878]|uniref:DUF4270 domain-containing protein n=1 Tax=Capnocytophaga sp. oral taxon 878 TaxID=1316596 RepID=UPI000D047A4D|nr:DUF4270 domain-containing protein [Capnocytophaga sp. oral taxon 878]AVM50265.1 DUF4270 domain-containing protein [Capnocytophaga sp. oral taxon 878]